MASHIRPYVYLIFLSVASASAQVCAIPNGCTGASTASGARTNLGAAPTASPTFTGTVTFPDSSTVTSSGHNYIGIGTAACGGSIVPFNGCFGVVETAASCSNPTGATACMRFDSTTGQLFMASTDGNTTEAPVAIQNNTATFNAVTLTNGTPITFSSLTLHTKKALGTNSSGNLIASTIAGAGAGLTTGPTSGTANGHVVQFQTTTGQISDTTFGYSTNGAEFTTGPTTATGSDIAIFGGAADGSIADSTVSVNAVPQSVQNCGTAAACSNTGQNNPRIMWGGPIALVGGTKTITGMTSWTSTSTFVCNCSDRTTAGNACNAVPASATSITLTGTGTDSVTYDCVGN